MQVRSTGDAYLLSPGNFAQAARTSVSNIAFSLQAASPSPETMKSSKHASRPNAEEVTDVVAVELAVLPGVVEMLVDPEVDPEVVTVLAGVLEADELFVLVADEEAELVAVLVAVDDPVLDAEN